MTCLSFLLTTQVNCDMTLNVEVKCLVYEGPEDNCYSIQICILDVVMNWLLCNMAVLHNSKCTAVI